MSEIREHPFGDLTLRILRDQCIGTAACRNVLPEVLDLDEHQVIDVLPDAPETVERERLAEACQVCPVAALELLDENGELLAP